MACPGRFNLGKDSASIVWRAGWDPGLAWMGAEYLTPTGIRSPDCPAVASRYTDLDIPAHQLQHVETSRTEADR